MILFSLAILVEKPRKRSRIETRENTPTQKGKRKSRDATYLSPAFFQITAAASDQTSRVRVW